MCEDAIKPGSGQLRRHNMDRGHDSQRCESLARSWPEGRALTAADATQRTP